MDLVYQLEYLIHTDHSAIVIREPTAAHSTCPFDSIVLSSSNSSYVAIPDIVEDDVENGEHPYIVNNPSTRANFTMYIGFTFADSLNPGEKYTLWSPEINVGMVTNWTCGSETVSFPSGGRSIPFAQNATGGFNWTDLFKVSSNDSNCPITQIAYKTSAATNFTIVGANTNITSISQSNPAKYTGVQAGFFTPSKVDIQTFTIAVCGKEYIHPDENIDPDFLFKVDNTTHSITHS